MAPRIKYISQHGIYCSWLQESNTYHSMEYIVHGSKNQTHITAWNILFMAPRIKHISQHGIYCSWLQESNTYHSMEYIVHGSKNQTHITAWNILFMAPRIKIIVIFNLLSANSLQREFKMSIIYHNIRRIPAFTSVVSSIFSPLLY